MRITLNLKNNYKLVPEGERILIITKAECTPSGKPNKMSVTFQDSEGGYINSRYNFDNDKSVFAMGKLLEVALGLGDGDDFDTKTDTPKLIGKKLRCTVKHSVGSTPNEEGELPTFANVNRVIELIEESDKSTGTSPRSEIANDSDYGL